MVSPVEKKAAAFVVKHMIEVYTRKNTTVA
jgi:hypothetical protein